MKIYAVGGADRPTRERAWRVALSPMANPMASPVAPAPEEGARGKGEDVRVGRGLGAGHEGGHLGVKVRVWGQGLGLRV